MKMEIPQEIQAVLRCVECNELLSCGPVFLVHKTSAAICGRCSQQSEEETTRSHNLQYEATAKLLSFPCTFATNGCPEKMEFSEHAPNTHERECDYRPFMCPVVEKGSCDWIGSCRTLLEHCRDAHPTHLFENADVLPRPDLTRSHLVNYIITAFHLIFLLHLKICASTGMLYHSVRLFNSTKLLANFSYSLKIEGNNLAINKEGSILPSEEEHSSNSININRLLNSFGGNYDDYKFTLTIRSLHPNCLNCLKVFENVTDSKFCLECQGNVFKCEFNVNGCSFVDVNRDKCWKHEIHFCKYQKECWNCEEDFVSCSFIDHLFSSNSCFPNSIKSNINSVVRVTKTRRNKYILFPTNNIRNIICYYTLTNSYFYLSLTSSLPFFEMKNLICSIELADPQTKYSELLTPQIINNDDCDWSIKLKLDNFPSWKTVGIDIKINIT